MDRQVSPTTELSVKLANMVIVISTLVTLVYNYATFTIRTEELEKNIIEIQETVKELSEELAKLDKNIVIMRSKLEAGGVLPHQ